MHKIKAFIPHLFTLGNLFCGCLGIIYAFAWKLDWAAYMVFLAAFLDFFDGFFARILKVPSELGKQLDSLADMVSFGVVPGVVMYQYLKALNSGTVGLTEGEVYFFSGVDWLAAVALMIPLFSCYRLAKFNLDTRQSHGFIGLPTPANAIFFVSLMLLISRAVPLMLNAGSYNSLWDCGEYISTSSTLQIGAFDQPGPIKFPQAYISDIVLDRDDATSPLLFQHVRWSHPGLTSLILPVLFNKYIILGLIVIFSFLLISELPLFALKFKNFGWNDNKIRYLFLGLSAVLLICFWLTAIPFIVILYLLLSIINNLLKITV